MNRSAPLATLAILLSTLSPANAAPCSPADLNEDGLVDFADYLDFLNLYDAQDLRVDFNQDGLVDFSDYLEFLNLYDAGCLPTCSPSTLNLACEPLLSYPYANFVNAYLNTSAVWIAVDPFKSPDLTGKTTRVYITTNRTWAPGDALVDARGTFQTITWPGGSIAAGTFTLANTITLPADAGEDVGVPYDLIIDENSNGLFDACDKVDGQGPEGGFYKFTDITQPNPSTPVTQVNTVSIPVGRVTAGFEDQRWYYPANIASRGQLPLVMIGHGSGHLYTWYDHLGQHLASYGMIVISFENTFSPNCIIDHTNTIIALQATLGGGVLNNHINPTEIYWIGHSRGGDAVGYAWPFLNQGGYTPMGGFPLVFSAADVKYIQAIAPINGHSTPPITTGTTTADFMLLYGAADGDVCGCPSNEITWSFLVYERALARRNSVYIQGADHNVFNCCGGRDFIGPPGTELGRTESQKLQKALTLASIKYYRTANVPCGEMLWRQYESFKPGATSATATVDYELRDSGPARKFVIDDFQTSPALDTSSSGGPVSFSVTNVFEGLMRDPNSYAWPSDPMNGMSRSAFNGNALCAVFDYDDTAPSRHYTFAIVPAGRDTTPYTHLSFRACQQTQHPFTRALLADQTFEVELEDNAANTSRIRIDAYTGGIEEVYQRSSGPVPGWQNEFETIKLRLTDFTTDGRPLDLTNITKVRLLFGASHGTNQGRLALDDLEFVK